MTRAKRAPALDEGELRQLSDLSFSAVAADIASSEPSARNLQRSQREVDLESTHTDRTINELLAGSFSEAAAGSDSGPRASEVASVGAADATEDLIAPNILFPELTLKE